MMSSRFLFYWNMFMVGINIQFAHMAIQSDSEWRVGMHVFFVISHAVFAWFAWRDFARHRREMAQ